MSITVVEGCAINKRILPICPASSNARPERSRLKMELFSTSTMFEMTQDHISRLIISDKLLATCQIKNGGTNRGEGRRKIQKLTEEAAGNIYPNLSNLPKFVELSEKFSTFSFYNYVYNSSKNSNRNFNIYFFFYFRDQEKGIVFQFCFHRILQIRV